MLYMCLYCALHIWRIIKCLSILNPKYNKSCHAPALPTIHLVFRGVLTDLYKFLNVNEQEEWLV